VKTAGYMAAVSSYKDPSKMSLRAKKLMKRALKHVEEARAQYVLTLCSLEKFSLQYARAEAVTTAQAAVTHSTSPGVSVEAATAGTGTGTGTGTGGGGGGGGGGGTSSTSYKLAAAISATQSSTAQLEADFLRRLLSLLSVYCASVLVEVQHLKLGVVASDTPLPMEFAAVTVEVMENKKQGNLLNIRPSPAPTPATPAAASVTVTASMGGTTTTTSSTTNLSASACAGEGSSQQQKALGVPAGSAGDRQWPDILEHIDVGFGSLDTTDLMKCLVKWSFSGGEGRHFAASASGAGNAGNSGAGGKFVGGGAANATTSSLGSAGAGAGAASAGGGASGMDKKKVLNSLKRMSMLVKSGKLEF
jgi:hypothetical protein